MLWSRLGRLWALPGRNLSARARWEYIGRDRDDAFRMMDGSTSEEELRRRGAATAVRFRQALDVGRDDRVLEIGCGVARLGRELAPLCGTYVGTDISRSLLGIARERTAHLHNAQLVHASGPALEGVPGTFDRILCHLVFLHMEEDDIRECLTAARRLLAPDGLIYFDAWNIAHSQTRELLQRESRDPRLSRQPHRSRFYSREAVESWSTASRLEPVWLADQTFLLQAVAMRSDVPFPERQHQEAWLQLWGKELWPRGKMSFEP